MKKFIWITIVFLSIGIGGIRISYAHVRNKSREQEVTNNITEITRITAATTEATKAKTQDSSKKKTTISSNSEKKEVSKTTETSTLISSITETVESSFEEIVETIIPTSSEQENKKTEVRVESPTPEPTHTGVSYLGYHYDLGTFSGTGYVPSWTNTIYQWSDFPTHFLVEKNSYPGQTIFGLTIGSEVMINGTDFSVYDIVYNQANDQVGLDMVLYSGAAASMQVCVTDEDDARLNLYFLN